MIDYIITHGGVPGTIFVTLCTMAFAQVLLRLGL